MGGCEGEGLQQNMLVRKVAKKAQFQCMYIYLHVIYDIYIYIYIYRFIHIFLINDFTHCDGCSNDFTTTFFWISL